MIKMPFKRITYRWLPFIFICYLPNYLDRVNVGCQTADARRAEIQ